MAEKVAERNYLELLEDAINIAYKNGWDGQKYLRNNSENPLYDPIYYVAKDDHFYVNFTPTPKDEIATTLAKIIDSDDFLNKLRIGDEKLFAFFA